MKIIKYTSILLFLGLLIYGCRKDDSKFELRELPAFYIDTVGGLGNVEPIQGAPELVITPKIVYEGDDADLSFLWRLYGSSINPAEVLVVDTLSTERDLKAIVARPPGTYTAELQATQNSTGLKALMRYTVVLNAAVGYGWLLAHETPQGDTEIAHIRTADIVYNLPTDEIRRTVYSSRNRTPLPGKPLRFYNSTFIVTDKTAVRVASPDYGKTVDFVDLFAGEAPAPKPEGLVGTNFIINDGVLYWYYSFANRFLGAITLTDDKGYKASPRSVSVQGANSSRGFFDEKNRRFVRFLTNESGEATPFSAPVVPPAQTPRFNLYNINKELLSDVVVGVSANTTRYGFFRDLDQSKTWMYGINFATPNNPDAAVFELNAISGLGTEINQAKFFELGSVNSMVICATDRKIFSFTYGSQIADVSSNFSTPANEQITCMRIFKHAGNGSFSDTRNNRLLMVATWDAASSKGKLYILALDPITGAVTPTPLKVIDGFGKIVDMIVKTS